MTTNLKQLLAAADAAVPRISPAQAQAMAASGAALVVDVRDAPEVEKSGKAAGAMHVSRGMLEFHADPASPYYKPELRPDARVILYCASGGRSALAVQSLHELGYVNVAHLDGGFKAWQAAGQPVSKP